MRVLVASTAMSVAVPFVQHRLAHLRGITPVRIHFEARHAHR